MRGTLAHTRTHTYSPGALHNTCKALPFNERNLWRLGCSRPDLAINKLGTFFSFLVPFNASPAVWSPLNAAPPHLGLQFWEDLAHCLRSQDVGLISKLLYWLRAPEWSCHVCLWLASRLSGCKLCLPLLFRPHWAEGRGSFQGDLPPPKHQLSVVLPLASTLDSVLVSLRFSPSPLPLYHCRHLGTGSLRRVDHPDRTA